MDNQLGAMGIHNNPLGGVDNNGPSCSPSDNCVTNGPNNSESYENKVFVGGLRWDITPARLRDYFSQFGLITDIMVLKDPVTQKSRGFGFITFADATTVQRVLAAPIHMLDGKRIDAKRAAPRSTPKYGPKVKKVFVGGVSQETPVEEVNAYFSQFGIVQEAIMVMDQKTKRHRGFGFVTFESEDAANRICEIHFHSINGKQIECKKAHPKDAVQVSLNLPNFILPLSAPTMFPQANARWDTAALLLQWSNTVAATNYSNMLGGILNYSSGNYRYSPYPHLQNFTLRKP